MGGRAAQAGANYNASLIERDAKNKRDASRPDLTRFILQTIYQNLIIKQIN